jgi:hypothetical protein
VLVARIVGIGAIAIWATLSVFGAFLDRGGAP